MIERRRDSVYVHYIDCDRRLDEWVSLSSVSLVDPNGLRSELVSPISAFAGGNGLPLLEDDAHGTAPKLTRRLKRRFEEVHHVQPMEALSPIDQRLEAEHCERTKVKNINVVEMAGYEMTTWYFSPYPADFAALGKVHVCEFCLKYFKKASTLDKHAAKCPHKCPPGTKIYTSPPTGPAAVPQSREAGNKKASSKKKSTTPPSNITPTSTAAGSGELRPATPTPTHSNSTTTTTTTNNKDKNSKEKDKASVETTTIVNTTTTTTTTPKTTTTATAAATPATAPLTSQPAPPTSTPSSRVTSVAMYEVDGAEHKFYCQSLCLLSKLFLDHKTLYFDVEHFLFYVLCEVDTAGVSHVVGYFSKEKHSSEGYNLACILTLPAYQRRGYGRLLISLSYALSRVEDKIGTPERPLSDLGAVSYRSYWTRVVLEALRNVKIAAAPSIPALVRATNLRADDIIQTLQSLSMLKFYKGQQIMMVSTKVVEEHLKTLPPQWGMEVDMSRLKYEPRNWPLPPHMVGKKSRGGNTDMRSK